MMSIDLRRLYYGATAFLVFLVAFFAAQTLADQVLRLVVVSSVPMSERNSMQAQPVVMEAPPATPGPVGAPVPPPTLSPEQRAAEEQKERARLEDYELRSAKEGVVSSLAMVLVALPIWFFHWRRWHALTRTQSPLSFRLYVHALMLITIITAVVRGGGAVSALLKLPIGAADFSSRYASLTFVQDLVGSLLGALIALLAWWYHWAMVRTEREER
jgi:uncharacterized membrane protein YhaH (DUF805 family)